ncbi:aldo/keto reductase [Streptomyces goshikiensis]|uniref:aldo/keto reductase n=1 Tax=Streptomyces goshikiensis TaxID=1942 RepID=UPI0036FF94A7
MAQLGLGLIGIGRPWPTDLHDVPSSMYVAGLLEQAVRVGVRFFDTAPAYGLSEARFGAVLRSELAGHRDELTVATKCGETWDAGRGSHTDHSPAGLEASVEESVLRLGRIDVLQLHKATEEAVSDERVLDTLVRLAATHGIPALGVSAKDQATCEAALRTGVFSHIQCPVNPESPVSDWARSRNSQVRVVGNRPYGSGQLLRGGGAVSELLRHAIDSVGENGIVLTGTTNETHLEETAEVFRRQTVLKRETS